MKYIVSGTHRPGSRTLQVSKYIQSLYAEAGEKVEIIDLMNVGLHELTGVHYGTLLPDIPGKIISQINQSEGLHFVVPEYNGSLPGILKLFIDHWKYPDTFEHRPVCFVGLGGMFGGLRPIEHLQQIMGYRSAFQFPDRVFMINVWNTFKDGVPQDPMTVQLLKSQVAGFQKFCKAIKDSGLDANTLNSNRVRT